MNRSQKALEVKTIDTRDDDQINDVEDTGEMMVEKELKEIFKREPDFLKILQKFSYYLATVGLDFEEACLMVRYKPEAMRVRVKQCPTIQELIDIKEMTYKANLIKTISEKAAAGDDKLSTWLLERRFPEEFNGKKGGGGMGNPDADLLGMAIRFVQKSSDSSGLIKESSGSAFLLKKNSSENILTSLEQVLK